MAVTQDVVAQKVTIDAETRAAIAAACKSWFQVRIIWHQERVGMDRDFDPDAMVQNFVVGLIGYWTPDGLSHL